MSAVTTLPFRAEGWTVDDLDGFPSDGYRYELLDGALLVSPPPELPHQYTAFRLASALATQLPPDLTAVPAAGLYYDHRNYRIPDVVVFSREVLSRPSARIGPLDVVLAVELTSPGSERTDRVLKPAEYAAAGIEHYWRLELEQPLLVTHRLVDSAYRETARYDVAVELLEPVPLRLILSDLLP